MSIKDPGNTFNLAKGGQELCRPWYIFHGIFIETPLHILFSNIKIDKWYPAVGLRCIIPPRHLSQLKTRVILLLSQRWARTLPSLIYFSWDIYRYPPPQFVFKYENWYLIPCCGLEVHYPTRALKSVKDPGNTFTLAKGGQELCRPWYIFHGIFIDTPLHNLFSNIKIDIWNPAVGLRCIIPPKHLRQLKTRAIPLT